MYPTDEFMRHAAECEQMAKFMRDPESVATWNRMAERQARRVAPNRFRTFQVCPKDPPGHP
jgi:hypothetical protein